MAYYLGRMHNLNSKTSIVVQLSCSDEAHANEHVIEDRSIRNAVTRYKWLKMPVIGALLRLLGVKNPEELFSKNEIHGSDSDMKTVVMIVGMHRSGTSCLTGSLQQCGLYLGEVYTEGPFNRKGVRENARIMCLNDALLAKNSADWRTPPVEVVWDQDHIRERDDIIREFDANSEKMWGFKDPRVLFTFPFWKEGLQNIKMVGTFRHPVSVAQSLNFRNQMAMEDGLELWYAYNCKLLALLQEYGFPLISFDVPSDQYLASVEFVTHYLGLNLATPPSESTFFEETLRTQNEQREVDVPRHIMDLYEELQGYARLRLH